MPHCLFVNYLEARFYTNPQAELCLLPINDLEDLHVNGFQRHLNRAKFASPPIISPWSLVHRRIGTRIKSEKKKKQYI